MSSIFVKIGGVEGEADNPDYAGQISCVGMRHAITLPVVSAAVRVEGTSNHGPMVLTHQVDKASPVLKQAVLKGTNLGTVEITRLRTVGGQSRPTEVIMLSNAFAVRVDVETPVDDATLELSDELLENFHLEYSEIRWSQMRYIGDIEAGKVEGGWSVATQSIT